MKADTRKFLESLQPELSRIEFTNDDILFLPYLGNINVSELSPLEILKLFHEDGFKLGVDQGKTAKMTEIQTTEPSPNISLPSDED